MKKYFKIIILAVVVLLAIIGAILVKNLAEKTDKNATEIGNEENNNFKSIFNKSESESEQKIDISNMESIDREIAKILFSEYFKDEFNEKLITEAKYDKNEKEFTCTYIIKTYDNPYDKDSVKITTEDFITYWYHTVEHTYDEEREKNIPHSYSAWYTGISNKAKNKIIELANSKGYPCGKNLTDKDYERILEIVFENDKKDLEKTIQKNNFILKNYYLSGGRVYYMFIDSNNEKNYIEINSSMSGVSIWNVYGVTTNQLYSDLRYSNLSEAYIVDYYIKIENSLDELEKIDNTLN